MLIALLITLTLIYIGLKLLSRFEHSSLIDFDKKVIFITGSDSGIGNETAKYFHRLGFVVFAGCLDTNSAGAVELRSLDIDRTICDSTNRMHILHIDITQVDSIRNAVCRLDDFLKQNEELTFHCLINNAGVCIVGEYDWLTLEHVEKIINVNLIGSLQTIKLFLDLVIRHKSRIIIIGSVNGIYAYPGVSVYCATKAALNLFSQSLRFEMNKFGVRVLILNPGDYAKKTNIMSNQSVYFEEMIRNFGDQEKALYKGYIDKYIELTNQNVGITGSEGSDKVLFADLKKLVTHTNPPEIILSVPFLNRIILSVFYSLPIKAQVFIFQRVWNRVIKFKSE